MVTTKGGTRTKTEEVQIYKSILAIDVGMKTNGFAYIDVHGDVAGYFPFEGFYRYYLAVKEFVDLYKPALIIVGKPNRFYNVIAGQSKLIGIVCLIANRRKTAVVEINDTTARAQLFPGEGSKKKEAIKLHFPDMQEDAMDALIMARAGWKLFN